MKNLVRSLSLRVALAAVALATQASFAQNPPKNPTEETPYVQTPQLVVDVMLKLAGVRGTDFLIDLGSGDGRIVITAAKEYGARGIGIDYDPRLVALSTENAKRAGVASEVRFLQQDLFKTDLRQASVLTMYLLPEYNAILQPRLLEQLRPGTRIVSHDYGIGDWKPDFQVEVTAPGKPVGVKPVSQVMLWIMPARFEGRWATRVPLGKGVDPEWTDALIEVTQRFQEFQGSVTVAGQRAPIERGVLRGDYVAFRFEHAGRTLRLQGRVQEGRITGFVDTEEDRSLRWRAQRQSARK